jgi:hypothetical protein
MQIFCRFEGKKLFGLLFPQFRCIYSSYLVPMNGLNARTSHSSTVLIEIITINDNCHLTIRFHKVLVSKNASVKRNRPLKKLNA